MQNEGTTARKVLVVTTNNPEGFWALARLQKALKGSNVEESWLILSGSLRLVDSVRKSVGNQRNTAEIASMITPPLFASERRLEESKGATGKGCSGSYRL